MVPIVSSILEPVATTVLDVKQGAVLVVAHCTTGTVLGWSCPTVLGLQVMVVGHGWR